MSLPGGGSLVRRGRLGVFTPDSSSSLITHLHRALRQVPMPLEITAVRVWRQRLPQEERGSERPRGQLRPSSWGLCKDRTILQDRHTYHSQEGAKVRVSIPLPATPPGNSRAEPVQALEYFLSRNFPDCPPHWLSSSSGGPKPQLCPFNLHHV